MEHGPRRTLAPLSKCANNRWQMKGMTLNMNTVWNCSGEPWVPGLLWMFPGSSKPLKYCFWQKPSLKPSLMIVTFCKCLPWISQLWMWGILKPGGLISSLLHSSGSSWAFFCGLAADMILLGEWFHQDDGSVSLSIAIHMNVRIQVLPLEVSKVKIFFMIIPKTKRKRKLLDWNRNGVGAQWQTRC